MSERDRTDQLIADLRQRVSDAHADAFRRVQEIADISLMPAGVSGAPEEETPALLAGYPGVLPRTTLMGYFGEIIAGLVAECHAPHGFRWEVPVYLFRFHNHAFDFIEALRQGAPTPGAIPGRSGDDSVAFARDEGGRVSAVLVAEAKCYDQHDNRVLGPAHAQISKSLLVPVSLMQILEVLQHTPGDDAEVWARALAPIWLGHQVPAARVDMVLYICGQSPRDGHGYMACDAADPSYIAGRPLESIDVHIRGLWDFVRLIYDVGTIH